MAKRTRPVDYAGAQGKLEPERALKLDPNRYGFMPKMDGVYAEIHTDADGVIRSILSQSANEIGEFLPDFIGMRTGLPNSILQGEAEYFTDAAIRARETRGEAWIHLFDVSRHLGEYVARRPYVERRGLLHTWKAKAEMGEGAKETRDRAGWWHSNRSGDYVRSVSVAIRRLPVVELARGARAAQELWDAHVEREFGEGMVAVRLDAPMGAKGSKLKVKKVDTIDAVVTERDKYCVGLIWQGQLFTASCQGKKWAAVKVGDVVEIAFNGYASGPGGAAVPRFPRLLRVRPDKVVA